MLAMLEPKLGLQSCAGEKGIYERSKTSEMNETLVNETKEPSREWMAA